MTHEYVSTACQHAMCGVGGLTPDESMCIQSCKYCDAPCLCACHAGERATGGPLYELLRAAMAQAMSDPACSADDAAMAALRAMMAMPRTMPDRAADRLSEFLDSDRPEAEVLRRAGHFAVDLRVLINTFRELREKEKK